MCYTRCNKISKRCPGTRGFKLNIRRFSVQVFRSRSLLLFKFLKSAYGNCFKCLKKNIAGKKRREEQRRSREDEMNKAVPYKHFKDRRLRSFGRSNSFYSEAIADCLDFIKRNSISLDEEKPVLVTK